MSYKLHIDDQAYDPDVEDWRRPPVGETDWKIATTSAHAIIIVYGYGIPSFISFDHDLGERWASHPDTSMKFLKMLAEDYPDAILKIEGYSVHSKNSEGAKNIHAFMDSWKRSMSLP